MIKNKNPVLIRNGFFSIPVVGVEPTLQKEHDFESCASANSATPASFTSYLTDEYKYIMDLIKCQRISKKFFWKYNNKKVLRDLAKHNGSSSFMIIYQNLAAYDKSKQ